MSLDQTVSELPSEIADLRSGLVISATAILIGLMALNLWVVSTIVQYDGMFEVMLGTRDMFPILTQAVMQYGHAVGGVMPFCMVISSTIIVGSLMFLRRHRPGFLIIAVLGVVGLLTHWLVIAFSINLPMQSIVRGICHHPWFNFFVAAAANLIIFDFDGLIMDTETATFEAWREIYQRHGHPLTIKTWAQCVGSDFGDYDPKRELEVLIARELDWEPIHVGRRERVMAILTQYDALPGVRDRLLEAEELKLPCAVASSSPRWWVEHWLKHLGLLEVFENVTCLEDTGKVKPHPSLFQHAAGKLGAKPEEVVVLEDSLNGLRAAQAAQMRCVVVPGALTAHLDFTGAWRKHESLADFRLAGLAESTGATS